MNEWTSEEVATQIVRASRTAHRLPAVRLQTHFNLWPIIVRTEFERMAGDDIPLYRAPPSPAEIDQMLEVMRWMKYLTVDERLLLWMRAERYAWDEIGRRFGLCRTTAWRHWKSTILKLALELNDQTPH
jgi:hypothetical protein